MANNKKAHKKTKKSAHRAPVQAAAVTPTEKKAKKIDTAKLLGIIGAVVAAIAVIVATVLLIRSVPKKIKTEVEATVLNSYGYEVRSLEKVKKSKTETSEYDKETIYLLSGDLKSAGDGKWLDGGSVIALARVTTQNGEENIEVRIVNGFKKTDKTSYNQTLQLLKDAPVADWQARFE